MHGRLISRNRIGAELEKYGIKLFHGASNARFVTMPEPEVMLTVLRARSRFDKLVDETQEEIISNWSMPCASLDVPVQPIRDLALIIATAKRAKLRTVANSDA